MRVLLRRITIKRNTVISSDPLWKNESALLTNILNNTVHIPKKMSRTKKQLSIKRLKWEISNTATHNSYKTAH
jgi:hypothetical protein